MVINEIAISNFRCFDNVSMKPHKDLNIIVGENSVGKSSMFIALSKLFNCINTADDSHINDLDIRWGDLSLNRELSVKCTFSLNIEEQKKVMNTLFPNHSEHPDWERVFERMSPYFNRIQQGFVWNSAGKQRELELGSLEVNKRNLRGSNHPSGSNKSINELFLWLTSARLDRTVQSVLESASVWSTQDEIQRSIFNVIKPEFYSFAEFRVRPNSSGRSAGLDSFEGGQTASVLFNLKNNTQISLKRRYEELCAEFSNFFPALYIDAVETSPGSGTADVQFIQKSNNYPIPLSNVGAGVVELLTFITNLVASKGRIIVVEEPESHLHPHAERRLQKLILDASEGNQLFVITHDPYFVPYDKPKKIFRFANVDNSARIYFLPTNVSSKLEDKIKAALQDISKRELLFARVLLLVEDESQRQFIIGCADKLNYDLDSVGLSVIEVGGKDGFQPYIKIADSFKIPYICLEDLTRGSSKSRPEFVFRSLGVELEEYLEKHKLKKLMAEAKKEVGTSKQRVARYCGEHIEEKLIPDFFKELIRDAVNLCD